VIEGDVRADGRASRSNTAAEESGDGDRMAHAYMELADAGAHDAQARAQALILGLGFKVSELDKPVNSFSGGWRMRLQLARALMCPSDLLLLDEPTNHLDLDALVWLEAWLQRYAGTMLVISHDREFLDAVTNVTLHIESQKLTRYGGNYSAFETCARSSWSCSRRRSPSSRKRSPTCRSSSTASRPRPARPSRRKAASRRWSAWRRSRRCWPRPTSPSSSRNRPTCPTRCCRSATPTSAIPRRKVHAAQRAERQQERAGRPAHRHPGRQRPGQVHAGQDDRPRDRGRSKATITEGKGLNIGYFAQQELDVLRPPTTRWNT
jgi:ATP-binding cassette subfamily F protein 3